MAEAVAGLLVSALVGIAKDKLGSAIAEQANLMWNFGGDLEEMKDVLESISAVLEDAETRSVKEKLVQLLLKRLKDIALDISDVLEDYQHTDDRATAKNSGVLSCIPTAYKKIAIGNRMKGLRKELMRINLEFGNFKFINTQGTSNTNVQHYDKIETTSHFQPKVEGREVEKQEIINLLLHAHHDESDIMIVPIYALGGMGKTTLAQQVYNDDKFKKQYDCHIWVYVSQEFNLLKIGKSIISQVPAEAQQNRDLENGGLQVIMECLDNLLCNKKVLIVLDDLWEEDDTELRRLKSMLDVGKKVDVIVTTREEGIARKVSTSKLYKLQPLKDDVCWGIIKTSSQCNPMEFERVGLDIAKKCGGVPLAAQALGYMLHSKGISVWRKINDSDIWNETSDRTMLPSLKLSYQRMSPQLKMCFSYCAIFSKGHNIVEDDLIHQWSVLGFIETSKGKEYIKDLLGMSFLQVSNMTSTSQKHVVRYTMHDLVHDLARLTMADQLKMYDVAPPTKTSAGKYFRYSLLKKYDDTTKLENMPSKIRALHFSDSVQLNIQRGAFSFATCLRILDFSECSSGVLFPAFIGKLKQLRCLITPRMQNETLPKCITGLSKLQYLNLNQSTQISALPDSVGKLGCLKYLCLSGCSGISELPESFGDLKSLVHMDMSGCSGMTTMPVSFGNLKCMVHLDMSGCARIRELPQSFGDLQCLEHLDISGCKRLRELPDSLGNLKNLQHLELYRCINLKALPESLCGLTQLQYLDLSSCVSLDQLPERIGNLVGLKYLNMSYCHQIKKLPESLKELRNLLHFDLSCCRIGKSQAVSAIFRNLTSVKYLTLRWCGMHKVDFIGTLANLEHLDLSLNDTLKYLPQNIGNLKRLHTLDLSYCRRLEYLPESIGTLRLKSLMLEGCSDELMDQASSAVNYLLTLPAFMVRADYVTGCSNLCMLEGVRHVSELRIGCLENVRSLAEATKVKLSDKHNLLELTLAWAPIDTRGVQIFEDKELLEHLLPPTCLKRMCLIGYSSTGFPGWLMCIDGHLTNLVSIKLRGLPTCTTLPPLGQLPHLEELELINLSAIKIIDGEFCGGKKRGIPSVVILFH